MSKNSILSANQKKALAAILATNSVRAAAQSCGLAERTLWRYLSNGPFLQALRTEQAAIYTVATSRLTQGINQALDELEILITSAKSEAVRRAAVADWLGHALKLRELDDLEARISALEDRTA